MSNLNFTTHDIFGKNYLSWILNVDVHLISMNLGEIIKGGNQTSQ